MVVLKSARTLQAFVMVLLLVVLLLPLLLLAPSG